MTDQRQYLATHGMDRAELADDGLAALHTGLEATAGAGRLAV